MGLKDHTRYSPEEAMRTINTGHRLKEHIAMAKFPPVRTWRVRYHLPNGCVATFQVNTINKQFARWMARDRAIAVLDAKAFLSATVTVSLVHRTPKGDA